MAGLVLVPAAQAATFTVTTTADDATGTASNCSTPPATACSLRDAVAAANVNPGSTIQLAAVPYRLMHGQLSITASMTIAGQGSASTEIDQQSSGSRVLSIAPTAAGSSVTISGVELTGGTITGTVSVPARGGGILVAPSVSGVSVTLNNDLITQNLATGATATSVGTTGGEADGGGIDVTAPGTPSLTLSNTSVSGNTARAGDADSANSTAANGADGGKADGGGIDFLSTGTLSISGGAVSGNFAIGGTGEPVSNTVNLEGGDGGAAQAGGLDAIGTLALTGTAVENDVAESGTGGGAAGSNASAGVGGTAFGGGVVSEASATIAQAEITSDQIQIGTPGAGTPQFSTQGEGGGVALGNLLGDDGGDVTISDTTIAGDAANAPVSAIGVGGGLANTEADRLTIVNSTIEGDAVQGNAFGEGGFGGGLSLQGTTTLASDTISANKTQTGGFGGNIQVQSATVSVTNTIVADGSGPSTANGDNCLASLGGTIGDLSGNGHNLESDASGECGFTGSGDLHAEPQLGSLALNGGVTETMLPASTSPVIGAGGACIDPTSSARLGADERGEARPTGAGACDMGAVQVQAPSNVAAPAITGPTALGGTLTCSPGTWTGDGTLAFSDQWRRGTTALASGPAHTVVAADQGQSLSCVVTASSAYGAGSATSAAVTVPKPHASSSPPRPVVSKFSQSAARWRRTGKAVRHRPPVGTRFSFTLNEAATVTLTFTQTGHGRKVSKKKCVTQTAKNRRKPACTLTLTLGTVKLSGKSGKNSVKFTGRLSNRHTLKPGRYSVTITAKRAEAAASKSHTLKFTILA
ncbi:MAG TPA: choice-of-anchor Q domain-containing protein [Solirubrobacteraceae bacterium]|nr:choice-of-anchor Q domain-containing protein [Solirubrobacteraceae bacterium]